MVIRIVGWQEGLKKISLTKLLRAQVGLPLLEAKDCVDRCLNGEIVIIEVVDAIEAKRIAREITQLNALVELQDE